MSDALVFLACMIDGLVLLILSVYLVSSTKLTSLNIVLYTQA